MAKPERGRIPLRVNPALYHRLTPSSTGEETVPAPASVSRGEAVAFLGLGPQARQRPAADRHFGKVHSRKVLSPPAESAFRPSGEKATPYTAASCPSKLRSSLRVATSQSRSVLSQPP